MEWGAILTLTGALIVLFLIAFIWYINVGGVLTAIKKLESNKTRDIGRCL